MLTENRKTKTSGKGTAARRLQMEGYDIVFK